MYPHILLPTDGSALSREAVVAGIAFARDAQAAVLGCHVVTLPRTDEHVAYVTACATAQGVRCVCMKAHGHEPAREIVAMAAREACDLIYMASHGWKGDAGQWLGGVTLDVLHHSRVPVRVHKAAPQGSAGTRGQEEWR